MAGKRKRPRRRGKAKAAAPATPAPQRRHIVESPIARLKARGALNVYELQAADEILAAHAMESGAIVTRDTDLGMPASEPRPDAADDQAARRADIVQVYRRWRAELRGRVEGLVTSSVLLGEQSLRSIDESEHWRHGTAKVHLLAGLRHFAARRGNVPRGERGWLLTVAADRS